MMTPLALLAAAIATPEQPLAGQLYAAIWDDVLASSMIGNGDGLAALWYSAGSQDPQAKDLHIRDLGCRGGGNRRHCTFTLLRDGGVTQVLGQKAPDRLSCRAIFLPDPSGSGWVVKHYPPSDEHVHSQSTMMCKRPRN